MAVELVRRLGDHLCWLDVKEEDRSEAGMREGIATAENFIFVLSEEAVKATSWCVKELRWAVEQRRNVILLHAPEVKAKLGEMFRALPEDLRQVSNTQAIRFTRDMPLVLTCVEEIRKQVSAFQAGGGKVLVVQPGESSSSATAATTTTATAPLTSTMPVPTPTSSSPTLLEWLTQHELASLHDELRDKLGVTSVSMLRHVTDAMVNKHMRSLLPVPRSMLLEAIASLKTLHSCVVLSRDEVVGRARRSSLPPR
jgi:hypothetical protein